MKKVKRPIVKRPIFFRDMILKASGNKILWYSYNRKEYIIIDERNVVTHYSFKEV